MITSWNLGERLREARRTGGDPLATRNRLFVSRACFVLAGAGVVHALGSLLDGVGTLRPAAPSLLFAAACSVVGAAFAAVELAKRGGGRDAWFSLGLNALALVAALLLH